MCFHSRIIEFQGKIFDGALSSYKILIENHENIVNIGSSTDFNDGGQRIKIEKGIYIFIVTKDKKKFNLYRTNKILCKSIPP